MKTYLNLAIGVKARMQSLKNSVSKYRNAKTWRECRFANFKSPGNCQGFNDKTPVWYFTSQSVPVRNIKKAHDFDNIAHTGYYCDIFQDDKAFGIIGALSHGRFIAGYQLTMNDEHVFFPGVFTDEIEATRISDEHARVIAEQEMEYSQKYNDAQNLDCQINDNLQRLRECIVLRNKKCMYYVREEISDLIEKIKSDKQTLESDYAGVL